jgi:hypothetical protein
MATIKLHSNGNVITKDGKASCSCCLPCDDMPDILNVSGFDIEEDCNTGLPAPVAPKTLLRTGQTTMHADVTDVNYLNCDPSKIELLCDAKNELWILSLPLIFRPNDFFTECPEGCAAQRSSGSRTFTEGILGDYTVPGLLGPTQVVTISEP